MNFEFIIDVCTGDEKNITWSTSGGVVLISTVTLLLIALEVRAMTIQKSVLT